MVDLGFGQRIILQESQVLLKGVTLLLTPSVDPLIRKLTGEDVDTPQKRVALENGKEFPVMMPCIAARPRTERGYKEELSDAGFEIMEFKKSEIGDSMRADILVRKS